MSLSSNNKINSLRLIQTLLDLNKISKTRKREFTKLKTKLYKLTLSEKQ